MKEDGLEQRVTALIESAFSQGPLGGQALDGLLEAFRGPRTPDATALAQYAANLARGNARALVEVARELDTREP